MRHGLNTERYGVSFRIQSECGKTRTSITPNTDSFYTSRVDQIFNIGESSMSVTFQSGSSQEGIKPYKEIFCKTSFHCSGKGNWMEIASHCNECVSKATFKPETFLLVESVYNFLRFICFLQILFKRKHQACKLAFSWILTLVALSTFQRTLLPDQKRF